MAPTDPPQWVWNAFWVIFLMFFAGLGFFILWGVYLLLILLGKTV